MIINYIYNADGVRIGKSGAKTATYTVCGTQILSESSGSNTTYYLYDESGSPVGLTYKGKTYYYRKNLQGDIINITDSTGAKVVTYTYNAWGKIISMTGNMELAVNNPFRYRGYYYDEESGLYYLNSRYYDPQTGRFINADSYVSTGQGITGTNMFAYCANDPVNLIDEDGQFFLSGWQLFKISVSVRLHTLDALLSLFCNTASIGGYILNMKRINGVYHANFDCWQQYFGYNSIYDIMFGIGTSMSSSRIEFKIGNQTYAFWAWKGDYINLGAGAELGIYKKFGIHWIVDKSLALPMSMKLILPGKVDEYNSYTWWITSFDPSVKWKLSYQIHATFVLSLRRRKNILNCFSKKKVKISGWISYKVEGTNVIISI